MGAPTKYQSPLGKGSGEQSTTFQDFTQGYNEPTVLPKLRCKFVNHIMCGSLTVVSYTTILIRTAQLSSHSNRTIPMELEDIKTSSQVFSMYLITVINAYIHVRKPVLAISMASLTPLLAPLQQST